MPARSFLHALPGFLAAVLLLPAPATAASDCANRNLAPTADNLVAVRAALVCLHNEVRARHDLPPLTENKRLRSAAVGHSADMVSRRYFAHTDPSGTTLVDRVVAAHYIRSSDRRWAVGENLAWAKGKGAKPARVMRMWMASPGHRTAILRRSYRHLGVGIGKGVPSGGSGGATFTTDFGRRR